MMQTLKRHIITGFFLLVPGTLAVLVVTWVVSWVDSTLAPLVTGILGYKIPGLGLLFAVAGAAAAGAFAENVIGVRLIEAAEEFIFRIPIFNWVYKTIKQIFDAFSPSNLAAFKRVVLVEYPRKGAYSLGFVTNDIHLERPDAADEELVTVYIPTNHVYLGDFILVPKDEVRPTNISVQQGVQCALSAGAAIPSHIKVKKRL